MEHLNQADKFSVQLLAKIASYIFFIVSSCQMVTEFSKGTSTDSAESDILYPGFFPRPLHNPGLRQVFLIKWLVGCLTLSNLDK